MKKLLLFLILPLFSIAQQVTTFAGVTGSGYQDGPLATAKFYGTNAACFDSSGNMYVADTFNNKIRKISTDGMVITLAGSAEGFADGTGTAAMFFYPRGICVDSSGNLYVVDQNNNRIRKITSDGVVTTVAGSTAGNTDGTSSIAKFNSPWGICIDGTGNLYIGDALNNRIRKITPAGRVSTIAGSTMGNADGIGTAAKFWVPTGICIDDNNNLYVTDMYNHRIRKITTSGEVTTVAGSTWGYTDGPANIAQFAYPSGICIDNTGNLYVANRGNHNIRKIDTDGNVTTYAGGSTGGDVDGIGTAARFVDPIGICTASNGIDVYVTQLNYGKIRKITLVLSNEDFNTKKATIYPNPCKDKFNVVTNEIISAVYIYNTIGNLVYKAEPINNIVFIDNKLSNGIYIIHLISEKNDTIVSKLIIE